MYEEYKDEGLVVLGVCTSSGQENFEQVVKQTRMNYPVVRDPDQKTLKAGEWVVKWFPTYVIVDKKGVVRASGLFNDEGMESIIRTLLAEKGEASGGGGSTADAGDPEHTPFLEVPRQHFENPNESKLSLVGKPAPALHTTEWMNGKPRTLEELRGNVVLLDYWATW